MAIKSPFIMQMMADVINMPIKIHKSEQTCALGASMFAATASGVHLTIEKAIVTMGPGFGIEYLPNPDKAKLYNKRYKKYLEFGDVLENKDYAPLSGVS